MPVNICFLLGVVVNITFYILEFLKFLGKGILLSTGNLPALAARRVSWLNRQDIVNQNFRKIKQLRPAEIVYTATVACVIGLVISYWVLKISNKKFNVLFLMRKNGSKVLLWISKCTYTLANRLHPSTDNYVPSTLMAIDNETMVESDDSEVNHEYGPNAPSPQTRERESDEESVLSFKTCNCTLSTADNSDSIATHTDRHNYDMHDLDDMGTIMDDLSDTSVEETTDHLAGLEESERNSTVKVHKWLDEHVHSDAYDSIATHPDRHNNDSHDLNDTGTIMDDLSDTFDVDTSSVWSVDSTDTLVGDGPGDSADHFSFGSAGSHGNEAGKNRHHDEVDNMSVKTFHSKVSDISAYSTPNTAKGTRWGFTLIFNMINFSKEGLESRDGSENDEELVETFFKKLGSQVVTARNMSKAKLMEKLEIYSKEDHSACCYFVCFIMSHGSEEGIYCSDGELVCIAEMVQKFRTSQCPSLKDKPKTFVIDACLGSKQQMPESDYRRVLHDMSQNAIGTGSSVDKKSGLEEEDFLLIYSTLPGHVSLRSSVGSPWITQFIQLLEGYSMKRKGNISFDQVLKKLNKRMSAPDCYIKQISHVCCTLKKNLFLFNEPSK